MVDVLHWTEGQGTGHIKRINALLRSAKSNSNKNLRYWVRAEDPKFHSLLPGHVLYWDGKAPERFDLIVLDLEDELVATELANRSDKWVQLCRIGTPLGLPECIESNVLRISFERCKQHKRLNISYLGSLLDASPDEVLDREVARAELKGVCGFSDHHSVALTHANSADANAAFVYLKSATISLLESYDHVVVATGHKQVQQALKAEYNDLAVTVLSLNPIYAYYRAFDALIAPMGYNTYHEVGLFFSGKVEFRPMYPPDQALRQQEMPVVDRIGNREIFELIERVARQPENP